MTLRYISQIIHTESKVEGHGAHINKSIGTSGVRALPPFVVCEYYMLNGAGRPPHPCRGLQKISVGLTGTTLIDYSPKNMIALEPGDITSVMVGKGVIRSTRAYGKTQQASGLHVWMDVPQAYKRIEPSHVMVKHSAVSVAQPNDLVRVDVVTGSAFGVTSSENLTLTPAVVLNVEVQIGGKFTFPVPDSFNAFIYILEGNCKINKHHCKAEDYVEFALDMDKEPFSDSDTKDVTVRARTHQTGKSVRFLFCAAKPLDQPIFQQGPFVDVSVGWIRQAYEDYSQHKNGFEQHQMWNDHSD